MQATLEQPTYNGKNLSYTKELARAWSYIVGKKEVLVVRWYMGRSRTASRVYCTIWGSRFSGTGHAGGYGYDKFSAAFQKACQDAGITLDKSIAGVGDEAVRQALLAIGESVGEPNGWFVQHD